MKLAVCFSRKKLNCTEITEKMVRAQALLDFHKHQVFTLSAGAVGLVQTSEQYSNIQLFRETPEGNLLIVTGVPIDRQGNLDKKLQAAVEAQYHSTAQILEELDGAFAAAFWVNRNRKLVIVTDFLGNQPLYIFRSNGTLLMATDIKGIVASGLVDIEMDLASWGSFLSLGYTIGGQTLLEDVQLVEPACSMVYDPITGRLESSNYWSWPEPKRDMTLAEVDTAAIVDSFRDDMMAYLEHTGQATLLLSAGFDSRLILSILHAQGITAEAMTLTHKDELWGIEGHFAAQAGKMLGVETEKISPDRSFYSSKAYADYMIMNEASTTSMHLFITQVSAIIKSGTKAVWEGVGPGTLLAPFRHHLPNFDSFMKTYACLKGSAVWNAAFRVFGSGKAQQMYDAFMELYNKERAKYNDDEYGVAEFTMANKTPTRHASNPLKVYANHVLPFTPGFNRTTCELVLQIPNKLKSQAGLYLHLFKQHFPLSIKVPLMMGGVVYPQKTLTGKLGRTGFRLRQKPAIKLLRKIASKALHGSSSYWKRSDFIEIVLSQIEPDHPDLDAEHVRFLKNSPAGIRDKTYMDKTLLFYWQMWRWILAGQVTINDKSKLSQ